MEPLSLTLEQAVEILSEKITTVGEGWEELNKAVGLVSSQTVKAAINVPHFIRSSVDGYAINEQDLAKKPPLMLSPTHIIPAGSSSQYNIEPGTTVKVMTGAPIPSGTGAVIKQEKVELNNEKIKINTLLPYNSNIELAGSMLKKDQIITYPGDIYSPLVIELLATTGIKKVPIYKPPSVYVINSGSELEMPGSKLEYGKIFNSNQSMFLSLFKLAGCEGIAGQGKLADDLGLICTEIKNGLNKSDLLIITGGNSKGDFDLIPQALEKIGAEIIVNGISMRPGGKTVVAFYDNKLIFNVSGNPHAGYILFHSLIKPVLKKMQGINNPFNKWFDIKLTNNMKTVYSVRTFCKGALVAKNGNLGAIALRKSELNDGLAPMILDIAPNYGYKGDLLKGMLV